MVIFCYTYYTLTDIFPLGSMALCVVRTFLPRHPDNYREPGTMEQPAAMQRYKKEGKHFKLLILEPDFKAT